MKARSARGILVLTLALCLPAGGFWPPGACPARESTGGSEDARAPGLALMDPVDVEEEAVFNADAHPVQHGSVVAGFASSNPDATQFSPSPQIPPPKKWRTEF